MKQKMMQKMKIMKMIMKIKIVKVINKKIMNKNPKNKAKMITDKKYIFI